MQDEAPQQYIDRVAFRPILIAICVGFLMVNWDFFLSTSSVLLDPTFLSRFGLMLLEVGIVSALAGGLGLAVAELVLRREYCTQSMIRFLRLGRWLPFFVVFASPIWGIRWSRQFNPVFQFVIALLPTMVFTACYFYLSGRHTLGLNRRAGIFATLVPMLSDALLLAVLLQVYLSPRWDWFAPLAPYSARASAAVLLVGGFSFILHRTLRSIFGKPTTTTGWNTIGQFQQTSWTALLGAAILWALCFALWYLLPRPFRDIFAIAPLPEVIEAVYRMLLVGVVNTTVKEPLWLHVKVSVEEMAVGVLLFMIAGSIAVKVVQLVSKATFKSSWFFAVTHTVPVLIAVLSIGLLGIGYLYKAGIVAAVCFFCFVQSLWALRHGSRVRRILLALDNALPYAVAGMLFAELFASTAGLSFLIAVLRATGNTADAVALSLITFGLLAVVSLTVRLAAKIISPRGLTNNRRPMGGRNKT